MTSFLVSDTEAALRILSFVPSKQRVGISSLSERAYLSKSYERHGRCACAIATHCQPLWSCSKPNNINIRSARNVPRCTGGFLRDADFLPSIAGSTLPER